MPPKTSCILLVDDDPDAPFFVRRGLNGAAVLNPVIPVFSAEDAQSFLERAASAHGGVEMPLATLINVNMRGMDGLELLRWIRATPKLDRMPVILGSDSEEPGYIAQAAELGAQAYVRKHPDTDSIVRLFADAAAFARGETDGELFRVSANLIGTHPWATPAVRWAARAFDDRPTGT